MFRFRRLISSSSVSYSIKAQSHIARVFSLKFTSVSCRSKIVVKGVLQTKQAGQGGGSGSKMNLKYILLGFGLGTGVGGYLTWREYNKYQFRSKIQQGSGEIDKNEFILDKKPAFEPSRSIRFANERNNGVKLTLYQYQTCPFCCKVRAMMDFYGLSYDVVEVNPVLRTQLKWSNKYKKVPILIVEMPGPEGKVIQLNDSSMIISVLHSYLFGQEHSIPKIVEYYPTLSYNDEEGNPKVDILNKYFVMLEDVNSNKKREDVIEEVKWRKWADSTYVHLLSPNIYQTLPEALETFRHFDKVGEWDKNFTLWERKLVLYVGSFAMWIIGKKLKGKYHINDPRSSLYEESDKFVKYLNSKGQPFIGGTSPNLADLAVYGVLNSIEGCQSFDDLSLNSKIVSGWYSQVQKYIRENNVIIVN